MRLAEHPSNVDLLSSSCFGFLRRCSVPPGVWVMSGFSVGRKKGDLLTSGMIMMATGIRSLLADGDEEIGMNKELN